jgi:hypothetical protein
LAHGTYGGQNGVLIYGTNVIEDVEVESIFNVKEINGTKVLYLESFWTKDGKTIQRVKTCFASFIGVCHLESKSYVGSDEIAELDKVEMELYPNPTHSNITISTKKLDSYLIRIYDLNGRLVMEETSNKRKKKLDVIKLPIGSYVAVVSSDGRIKAAKKFMKM